MDDKTKKMLEDNFKDGEYAQLTLLVRLDELQGLIEHLKLANLNLAMLPHVKEAIDFQLDDKPKGELN
jgi:hypothetical protein